MNDEDLAYWINERERVRLRKEQGQAPPWSDDPIFQTTYFCNVRREDDKVTKWLAKHWREGNGQHPNFVAAMVLARMFNLPDHLEELGFPEGGSPWQEMKYKSKARRDRGEQVFNGAYLITTCGVKMDKIDYVYRVVEDALNLMWRPGELMYLAEAHHRLTSVNGLGSFLAAQVIADLKNTEDHPLSKAVDWWTWAAPGPGSLRGIRTLEGFENTSIGGFLPAMQALQAQILRDHRVNNIHAQDFQNCLCEFSKYVKVHGGGRSKRKYNGR